MALRTLAALEFFEQLPDPRQHSKILYPLREIILTTLSAIICGADSYVEIEEFGNAKLDFLRNFYPFANGIPAMTHLVLSFQILIQSNLIRFLSLG